jgi:enamine deaminase RidA (YjgF/YER057c/UK114 family)
MKRLAVLAGVGLMLVSAGQPLSAQERIVPARFQRTYDQFHYAPIVRVDNTLYLSGVVAGDPDPEQQFETLFRTLNAVLQEAGASLADVVEMTTFHVNMREHIETFMQVKDRHMLEPYPAWTAIGISELFSRQALVEIKVTAVVND